MEDWGHALWQQVDLHPLLAHQRQERQTSPITSKYSCHPSWGGLCRQLCLPEGGPVMWRRGRWAVGRTSVPRVRFAPLSPLGWGEHSHPIQERDLNRKLYVLVAQSCLTLCNRKDCSPAGSSIRGILQTRLLEWVAMPSSRESWGGHR